MNLGRNISRECWLSQSLFYQVLLVVSDGVFKENI